MTNKTFWQRLDQLTASCKITIDRPAGSIHPRYPNFRYPFDYGYLEGTQSMDQGGIDIWVGSMENPLVSGIICTVDITKNDAEMKLLIGCTVEEAGHILKIHNSGPQSGILIMRQE
jgi:inorganic pyrophosphatase